MENPQNSDLSDFASRAWSVEVSVGKHAATAERKITRMVTSRLDHERAGFSEAIRCREPGAAGTHEDQYALGVSDGAEGAARVGTPRADFGDIITERRDCENIG